MHLKYKQISNVLAGLFGLIIILLLAGYMLVEDISFTITSDSYKYIKTVFFVVLLILASVTIYLNFMIFYTHFKPNIIRGEIKEIITAINTEFRTLKFTQLDFFISFIFFSFLLLLSNFYYIKLALIILFLYILYILNKFPVISCLNNDVSKDNLKITTKYKDNYTTIFYLSKFIKIAFVIYSLYFFMWHLIINSYALAIEGQSLADLDIVIELNKSGHKLYLLYCLFINTVILDYCMESFIIYSTFPDHVLIIRLLMTTAKRAFVAASVTAGGTIAMGGTVVYSPLVEIPGVNEFQIRYGRGYGYATSLDYATGMIYQRYFTKEQIEAGIQKYSPNDRVLGGIYFRLLRNDVEFNDILKKNATVNELRLLGLRNY